MSGIHNICLLGLGEVGGRLTSHLESLDGLHLRAWDRLFTDPESKPSQVLQQHHHLDAAVSASTAASNCQLVISAVTAEQGLAAAQSVLPALQPGAWFLDVNSVSPQTRRNVAAEVEAAGGRYLEAAILSPIDPLGIASPILLGGPHAEEFLPLAAELGFSGARFCSSVIGKAAATKLCRSVVVKGMEALLTESLLAARHYGVENEVITSLENLMPIPDWPERARYMISRSLLHGERRAEEMREAAHTVRESGTEPLMSTACAERQAWAAQFSAALTEQTLVPMLDAIRRDAHKPEKGNSA